MITKDHNLHSSYTATLMKWILMATFYWYITGCDPARRINMKNASAHDAEITWLIKEDSILNSPLFMNLSTEVKFLLKPQRPYHLVKLSTGNGNWRPADFNAIMDDVDSLIIKTHYGVVRLGTEELKQFLWTRRRGIDKSSINIFLTDEMMTGPQ
jgi:hypothetical protein